MLQNFINTQKIAPGLRVMKSTIDGLGCFATVSFPCDSVIAAYTGERVNHREAMRRMHSTKPARVTQLDDDCYIDGSVGGNGTQYINHSCAPNADAVNLDGALVIFSLRRIASGEEITIGYLNSFEDDHTVCHCRSASCKTASPESWVR